MRKVIGALLLLFIAPVALAMAVALADGHSPPGGEPSAEALADVPGRLLAVYMDAARTCPGLAWAVPAAIGKVESGHGTANGARLDTRLDARPPIIGIRLDGSASTAAIRDTDGGQLDGDATWDRAVGPMQFLPATWRAHAVDGDGDSRADPQNFADAVHTATAYLCAHGAGEPATLRTAILAYNHAGWYADEVLATASRYSEAAGAGGSVTLGGYTLPVDLALLSPDLARRPHHDYPAWDLAVPEGTLVYAVTDGTVLAVTADSGCGNGAIVVGTDATRYTYCHGSWVVVEAGEPVIAGQALLLSGNTGRSTGPHVHLQIHGPGGAPVCPQPLLAALLDGRTPPSVSQLPTSGCSY